MSTKSPSRTADQFVVRLPEGMRERIAEFAKQNNRSMNAEIVQRLEWAMSIVDWKKEEKDRPPPPQQPIAGALSWLMTDEINRAAVAKGVPFDEMFAQIVLAGLYPTAPQVFYIAQLPGATKEDMRAALEASKGIVREDAALIVERFEKAPWAPEWMLERMRDSVDLTVVKENKVIFVQTKSTSPLPSSEQVKPRRVVRTVPKKTKAE